MSEMIEILREEHRNIEKLLLVLEQELQVFDHSDSPDYEILQAIVEYFQTYPETYHHPKEDLVFERLRMRNPIAISRIGDAEAEHELEGERLSRLARAVNDILAGREYPRHEFHCLVREFIDYQRQHMRREEQLLFPAAVEALLEEDWAEIDAQLNNKNDPLFGGAGAHELEALRKKVLQWEHEAQATRVGAAGG